jgi:hypothetical protein
VLWTVGPIHLIVYSVVLTFALSIVDD